MGALSKTTRNDNTEARITSLGKTLAVFPLAPAYGKVIAMANQNGILPYAISLISALSGKFFIIFRNIFNFSA